MRKHRIAVASILVTGPLVLAGVLLATGAGIGLPGAAVQRARAETAADSCSGTEPGSSMTDEPVALGNPLFQLDLEVAIGDNHLVGVEFDGTYYWVTGGNSGSDPNKLYKLNKSGALLTAYDQPGACTGWGGRDLAFDGNYLYFGCDDNYIHQINPATGGQTGTIHAPLATPRALAYDPATDHFWTANYDSTIYEISRLGTVVKSCQAVGLSTYGMAWDAVTAGGPRLWLWSQDGEPLAKASQFNPRTCALTGVSFAGKAIGTPTNNLAAGAAFSLDLVPGKAVLLGMHQASPDALVGYDVGGWYRVYLPFVVRP
jgi:hypothetical protein